MLFDHVEAAVLLLLAFHCLLRRREAGLGGGAIWPLAAGLAAGVSVAVNYLSLVPAAIIFCYAIFVCRPRRQAGLFIVGALPAALLLGWYHAACFGSPLALANTFQSDMFSDDKLILGVFGLPAPDVAWKLLFSLRRGLFITSPVLLLGLFGLWRMSMTRRRRPEALLFAGCCLILWLINSSFNHWHGGFSIGPRYLIPVLPFLALPLASAFARLPKITMAVAFISIALLLTTTAVDAQPPLAFSNPLGQYYAPLLAGRTLTIESVRIDGPLSVIRH